MTIAELEKRIEKLEAKTKKAKPGSLVAKELEEIKKLLQEIRDKPTQVPFTYPVYVQPYTPPNHYPNWTYTTYTMPNTTSTISCNTGNTSISSLFGIQGGTYTLQSGN